MSMNNKVNIFLRNPNKLGNFSVEIFYSELYKVLNKHIEINLIRVPFRSSGIVSRIFNVLFCFFKQSDINHVVGDISYCSLLMKKSKLVVTILDCVVLHKDNGLKKKILEYMLYRIPIYKASKIVAISESTKNDLNFFLNLEIPHCSIIPVTISKSFFNKKLTLIKKDFKHNILMIGTAPNKNIERAAKALEGIEAKLTIIGKLNNSQKKQLEKSKINFKEIDYPLSENEIINKYLDSDILLYPSTLEGFGMPIIEANVLKVCVITSNISSMPYVAGDSALLVNPYRVTEIKKAINNISKNPEIRQSLMEKGKKNSSRFNIKTIANQHISLYRSMRND